MTNQIIRLVLVLTLAVSAIVGGMASVQAIWPFDEGNNTVNQTGNQSSAGNSSNASTEGHPGYTPSG